MTTPQRPLVVVTGASSGIGLATARLFSSHGHPLLLLARRLAPMQALNLPNALARQVDVTDRAALAAALREAEAQYGPADAIVNNAGVMLLGDITRQDPAQWDRMLDVNVKGVLNGVAAVLPEFTAQKSGHVITTSSVAGLKAYPGGAVYGGTKWFVRDFMEVLRMESAMEGTNIRTATIYPAAVNTELLDTISDKSTAESMQGIYAKYGISPDRIADVVAFAIDAPEDTTINEFTVGPANQPW